MSIEENYDAQDDKGTADVCITASLLSLPFLHGPLHTDALQNHVSTACNVNYTLSKLRLCANVHLYCNLRQVRAQKRICYSNAIVHHL